VCVLSAVQCATRSHAALSTHTTTWNTWLPQHCITYKYVSYRIISTKV